MRSILTWCTVLGLAAVVAAPAAAQDPYEGKSADELLDFVRKRIADREGDEDTGQAYSRFRDQKSREFAQRAVKRES